MVHGSILRTLKQGLRPLAKAVAPRQYWRRTFGFFAEAPARGDELSLVPHLCDAQRTSIDVGAAKGTFSVQMLKASRDVIAFEPRPKQAADLAAMFNAVGVPVRVEAVALSDRGGTSKMRILTSDPGRGTVENANPLDDEDGSPLAEITVRVRRLDDYHFDSVGFMKIDVEGHELAVLNGALVTIKKNKPTLLIELEERHRKNTVADTIFFLKSLGYGGYFLLDGGVHRTEEFDKDIHQKSANISSWKEGWNHRGVYANSFVFLPNELLNATIRMALMTDKSIVNFVRILRNNSESLTGRLQA